MDRRSQLAAILAIQLELDRLKDSLLASVAHERIPSPKGKWELSQWCDKQTKKYTRFKQAEIDKLVELFELDTIVYRNRHNCPRRDALAITMCKLAGPTYLYRDIFTFLRSEAQISYLFSDTIKYLAGRYAEHLRWHPLLTVERLKQYAKIIEPYGGQGVIWGFIDGTFCEYCRPLDGQRLVYSGHKKGHGSKWQAIVTPDGLVISLDGPYEGAVNDVTMLKESGVLERIEGMFEAESEGPLFLYGDKAYACNHLVLSPYSGAVITPEQQAFNDSLQHARLAVEWAFSWITQKFTTNHFTYNLKLGLQPVAQIWQVSVLLANCLICLRGGNQVSKRFGLCPPSIEEYLRI